MAIYIKGPKPRTIKSLIKRLYSYKKGYFNIVKSTSTFFDRECIRLECDDAKNRSFDAIFEIVNTYFPNTSEKEVVKELLSTVIVYNKKSYKCNILYCPNISKPVCYFNTYPSYTLSSKNGDSKKSWRQLLRPLGITSELKLRTYLNNL